jgi:hypothetical protein
MKNLNVNKSQFAQICGISRPTLYHWLHKGFLAADGDGMIDLVTAMIGVRRMKEGKEKGKKHGTLSEMLQEFDLGCLNG